MTAAQRTKLLPGSFDFTGSATAGNLTAFTNLGSPIGLGGVILFNDSSSAGNATFTNNGGTGIIYSGGRTVFSQTTTAAYGTFINNDGTVGGTTQFYEFSSAGHGTFINNGGAVSGAQGGGVLFGYFGDDAATAEKATIINNGGTVSDAEGGRTVFAVLTTAGNSTLVANGGSNGGFGGVIGFYSTSDGGKARVEVFGNGELDITYSLLSGGITIGSIEGDGIVLLAANNLTVGGNNLSTIFSGIIEDTGFVTKVGSGTLTLTNANTYSGGTTVEEGELLVDNKSGSGAGSGPVQVNAGRLGGRGTIAGPVTIGTGNGDGALLVPGQREGKPGTLTIQNTLTFNSDATYKCELKTKRGIADEVVANGVTISGARFFFVSCGESALTPGTVFTVVDNTSATAISGIFTNLTDGGTITSVTTPSRLTTKAATEMI